jgi:hypothetical protein
MRKLFITVVSVAVLAAGCGGADDSADSGTGFGTEPPGNEQQQDSDGSDSNVGTEAATASGDGGTFDDPTPEASGSLPPDGFRIGDDVWVRTIPITSGQCFVQEGEGITPFTVWGTLNNDDTLSLAVSHDQDAGVAAEVRSDTMSWVAGGKDGTEVVVEHDFVAQSITGSGLFYNGHSNEWAYGSFDFTCTGE